MVVNDYGMALKLKQTEFINEINRIYKGQIDISNFIYKDDTTNGECICNVCGHIWKTNALTLLEGHGCPFCLIKEKNKIKRENLLRKYEKKCVEICENKQFSDIKFYYDENNKLMVSFYCHNKDINGNEHGLRIQSGNSFLITHNCSQCSRPSKTYTTDEWISLAKNKYPDFDYSKVVYINKTTDVEIGCKKHGFFKINPKYFLYESKFGCPECQKENSHNKMVESVISRCKKIHGDKYIYHKNLIKSSTDKIGIECPKHGIFYQSIQNHIGKKSGCPICYKENYVSPNLLKFDDVVERCNKIFNNKYTYHRETYVNTNTKTLITCPIHGDFWKSIHEHLSGQGCPKCSYYENSIKRMLPWSKVLEKFINVHKYMNYDYSLCENYYKGKESKIPIICHKKFKNGKEHGLFWMSVENHAKGCCCPKCRMSKLEQEVYNILSDNKITFLTQYHNKDILKRNKTLDFFLPEFNIAIECQGEQHFHPTIYRRKGWNDEKSLKHFEEVSMRDNNKYNECFEHGIEIIYYTSIYLSNKFCKNGYLGKVFNNESELIKFLKEKNKLI